jgi:tripartite-type tricarboxylate transporter receptor subunit TctC
VLRASKNLLRLAAVYFLAVASALAAYPERPIRIIVPFPAGAGNDLFGRMIGQKISEALGQPVVIENRSGAGGNIGTEAAAKSPPDGYTLLVINNAQTMNQALSPKTPFDVPRDFVGVALVAASPMLLVASNDFPAKNVAELIAYAKANPGKVNFGTSGYGTPQQFGAEMLAGMAGVRMTHVPYRGQAPSNAALATNEIQIAFGTVAGFTPLIKAGRIRPLAAAGTKPPKEFPDLPTVAQSGYPGFSIFIWYGLAAPAGTPPAVVKLLSDTIMKIMANPANRAEFEEKGFEVTPDTGENLTSFMKRDLEQWRDLVQKAKLTAPEGANQ